MRLYYSYYICICICSIVTAIAPEPYDANPQYTYGYSVQDLTTGDQKSHSETRNGDVVTGEYSLVEPDGALRTVKYSCKF